MTKRVCGRGSGFVSRRVRLFKAFQRIIKRADEKRNQPLVSRSLSLSSPQARSEIFPTASMDWVRVYRNPVGFMLSSPGRRNENGRMNSAR